MTDEGLHSVRPMRVQRISESASPYPSSGPPGHLLPQGEKDTEEQPSYYRVAGAAVSGRGGTTVMVQPPPMRWATSQG